MLFLFYVHLCNSTDNEMQNTRYVLYEQPLKTSASLTSVSWARQMGAREQ